MPLILGLLFVMLAAAGSALAYRKLVLEPEETRKAEAEAAEMAATTKVAEKKEEPKKNKHGLPPPSSYVKAFSPNEIDKSMMSLIPAGPFAAGEEQIVVELPSFHLSVTEVTNEQYQRFILATNHAPPSSWPGGKYPAEKASLPVVGVTWHDAQAYCKWANGRLPTELEWEKGARGTDGRVYPWGDTWLDGVCNSSVKIPSTQPRPVRDMQKGLSPWGVFQMAGNVAEWCADKYIPTAFDRYKTGKIDPPTGAGEHVVKGGSWDDGSPEALKACRRNHMPAGDRNLTVGFRIAQDYQLTPTAASQPAAPPPNTSNS